MARTRSQKKTTDINHLPPDVFFLIIQRLSLKNKFLLKAVCKKWYTFLISHILPKEHKLSIEDDEYDDSSAWRCIYPDHQFYVEGNHSIPLLPVRAKQNRKRFFEQEVTGVKVLRCCGGRDANRVIKYCLSEESSLSLQCLDVLYLQEPLVKVLPNLQHFSTRQINLVSLVSVLQYCPVLTHLTIETSYSSDDFVDTLMKLPKGLQYLKLQGKLCDLLAVFCSPAMETLESVRMESWSNKIPFNKPDARVRPAPHLQKFSMECYMNREEGRRIIVDFLKECPALKKIYLRVTGLSREDFVNIYSQLSNLEMISLYIQFKFDDVIRMILLRNRESLKYLEIGDPLLNLESIKKLAEFTNLQILFFWWTLPSDEELMAFAQRRLDVSQSRVQLKSCRWNENHFSDPLGSALQDANIELVANVKFPSVMD